MWDVRIPEQHGDFKAFMIRLRVRLPNEEIETGYEVKWQTQFISHFEQIAYKMKFRAVDEWSKGERSR